MLCLDGNPHDTYTIIQVLNVLGLQCMPHSGMVWAHRNCTVSWNQYLKARENKHAVSGLQNLSGLRLLSKKKKKKKWIVNILFFTAVNHRVTVLFGQVFFFVFLFLVRSQKSYFCCDNMLPSSKPSVWPEKHAMYFFSIFHDPLNTECELHSVCAVCFFCVNEHMLWLFLRPAIKRYHMYELWMDC